MIVREMLDLKGTGVVTVTGETKVSDAVRDMCDQGVGSAVITSEDGLPVGIITERDIMRQFAKHGGELGGLLVSEIMTSPVRTGTPDSTLQEVMEVMTANRFRHLPIVDAGKLVGIVSIGDVVKARLRETESEAESLRQYITS